MNIQTDLLYTIEEHRTHLAHELDNFKNLQCFQIIFIDLNILYTHTLINL